LGTCQTTKILKKNHVLSSIIDKLEVLAEVRLLSLEEFEQKKSIRCAANWSLARRGTQMVLGVKCPTSRHMSKSNSISQITIKKLFDSPDEGIISIDETQKDDITQVSAEENAFLTAPYT
jgi:phage FluMu protein Com